MALNKEDKADVSRSMGKALANKVSKVTNDRIVKVPVHSKTPGVYRSGPDTVSTKRGNMRMKLSGHAKYM